MRKFIPLSTFKDLFANPSDLIQEEGMTAFKKALDEQGMAIADKAGFTQEEFINFRHTLSESSNVVFYGWIEQQDALKEALLGIAELARFEDRPKYLEHALSDKFKRFISPCLANVLLGFSVKNDRDLRSAFSYVQLLDTDHRAVVESKLFTYIGERLDAAKEIARSTTDEQVLINTVKPLCADEIIQSVNYLSRASYALKLSYIDRILDFLRVKSCTTRFANWTLKKMEDLQLNSEHNYKIIDLRRELSTGELLVRNRAKGRTPVRWKTIGTTIFILGISSLVFWILYFQPFSTVEDPQFTNNTSFKQFTQEERIRIDSLLQEMDNQFDPNSINIDPTNPYDMNGSSLTLRKAFANPTMERVYEDLILDVELKEAYPRDSCKPKNNLLTFKRVTGVKDLSKRTARDEAVIKNESDYDIIVYVSEDRDNGEVYSMMVHPDQTETFKINTFNTIFIVAGNDYQKFTAPANAPAEALPSAKFTHHFCDTDLNYAETINTAYKIVNPRNSVTKFMVMGSKNGYVHLVDIHQALEEY